MASVVSIGPKGGSTSAETLRVAFSKHQDEPVRIRLAFQAYTPPNSYGGLRDHTIRFRVKNRREFEKIHSAVVDLVESMLQTMGYKPDAKEVEALAGEDAQDAMAVAATVDEDRDDTDE